MSAVRANVSEPSKNSGKLYLMIVDYYLAKGFLDKAKATADNIISGFKNEPDIVLMARVLLSRVYLAKGDKTMQPTFLISALLRMFHRRRHGRRGLNLRKYMNTTLTGPTRLPFTEKSSMIVRNIVFSLDGARKNGRNRRSSNFGGETSEFFNGSLLLRTHCASAIACAFLCRQLSKEDF